MENTGSREISLLLADWSKGDEVALEQLMPLVYDKLRRMAHGYMKRQPSGHTFQTTELIHETYLKLAKQEQQNWQNRAHFFGVGERHAILPAAAFLAVLRAGVIDQNVPHCTRRDAEKMSPILPILLFLFGQL